MGKQEYILTPKLYKTLKKKIETTNKQNSRKPFAVKRLDRKFTCRKCGKPFEIGDIIVSKPVRSGRKRYYHKSCFESMFYDIPDDYEVEAQIRVPVLISNN